MLRLSGTLLLAALVCGLILAVVYKVTSPVIAEQKQILLEKSLQSVLPADSYRKNATAAEQEFYEAQNKDGEIAGWCLPISSKGYGGAIKLMVGVNKNGTINGIQVLEHNETPGLGSKICEIGYKQTEPAFLAQFKGKNIKDIKLVKKKTDTNIEAITGATISSKAVVDGVQKGVSEFLKTRDIR